MAEGPLVHVHKAVTSTLKVAWSNLLDEEPKFQMENSSICMIYVSMSWDAVVSCLLENLLCGILNAYMMYIDYRYTLWMVITFWFCDVAAFCFVLVCR